MAEPQPLTKIIDLKGKVLEIVLEVLEVEQAVGIVRSYDEDKLVEIEKETEEAEKEDGIKEENLEEENGTKVFDFCKVIYFDFDVHYN